MSDGINIFAICTLCVSLAALFLAEAKFEASSRTSLPPSWHVSKKLCFGIVAAILLPSILRYQTGNRLSHHPIDGLIPRAKELHESWLRESSSGGGLAGAVSEYRKRYSRNPPPNFDHWYQYASSRSMVAMHDFGSMETDLVSFWGLSPAEIRTRTWELISNPWNDVGGISIRNGSANITPGVVPTHLWMLEGIVHLIGQFSQWLPDMDLAFNLNDEPRVTVPFSIMEELRRNGLKAAKHDFKSQDSQFSKNRAAQWTQVPEKPIDYSKFHENSIRRTFYDFGSIGCSPNSRSRRHRMWDTHALCTTCASPHSIDHFLSNWTLAAEVCHQPDLANLHGFYLSPAAFKVTLDLLPVFSQSKAHGFNDILYPSAWNYMDKAKYEPSSEHLDLPFREKQNTLFWRGATSEGVSAEQHSWQGMNRQRLVHLGKNFTSTMGSQTLLLPYPLDTPGKSSFAYTLVKPADLMKVVDIDVAFVGPVARCAGLECKAQENEFGMQQSIDFQAHWRYRYLFDGDGAGFSGRFLPFLQSRSLPFKSALFREWYDHRVTAWLHFVPQDLRLHGLFSSLAYFAGVEGTVNSRKVNWKGRKREAEVIAEEGREWAAKALRKEDMEAYFFRLLLEWGRLTDDSRDTLGFSK